VDTVFERVGDQRRRVGRASGTQFMVADPRFGLRGAAAGDG